MSNSIIKTTKRMFAKRNVVIVAAKRTPIGTFMGGLSSMTGPQLGTIASKGALVSAGIAPEDIDEVYLGNVNSAGSGQAPARQVALGAGLKLDTPCTTVNKVCASGMKTVMLGATAIAIGDRNTILCGGFESMSKAPHYLYLRKPTGYGNAQAVDSIQYDTLTDVYNNILMGACTEKVCSDLGLTREAQD